MQEVFEKIIEKLKERCDIKYTGEEYVFPRIVSSATRDIYEKDFETNMTIKDAIEIVKQEAEKFGTDTNVGSNGWIPCSERLPEEKINPVTQDYYKYPVMFENDGVEDIKYYYFGNGHWRYGLQIMDDYVTHWMDIEPYQPKGE